MDSADVELKKSGCRKLNLRQLLYLFDNNIYFKYTKVIIFKLD